MTDSIPAPGDELATLIREALNAANHAGYESARYVHDATPAAVRAAAVATADELAVKMWHAFYDYASEAGDNRRALRALNALAGARAL